MEIDRLLGQLSSVAGLKPSRKWLEACRSHLNQQGKPFTEDNVLFQALDFDLRDVVRRDIHDGTFVEGESSSVLLRKKCKESMACFVAQSSSAKAILPSNFRACLQIEELLDVSKNAEERLAHGPALRTAPTPIGDQSRRCLKMLLTDGYFENGSFHAPTQPNGTVNQFTMHSFSAMETSPIPNLSVHSRPGMKIILSGSIVIRYGILMLDPSNTIVLGGCIPALISIQKKAMELAAKKAGVGIDPTFRALVWNPETGLDDTDEGEHESGDVQPMSGPLHQQPTSTYNQNRQSDTPQEQSDYQRTTAAGNLYNIATKVETTSYTNDSNSEHIRPQVIPNVTNENPYSQRNQNYETSNPYRMSENNINIPTIQRSTSMVSDSAIRTTSTPHIHNPYSKSTGITSTNSPERDNEYTADQLESINQGNGGKDDMDSLERSSISILSNQMSPPRNLPTVTNISINGAYTNLSPTALTEPMNFADFHALLEKMIVDPSLYRKYERVTFVVPCKLHIGKDSSKNVSNYSMFIEVTVVESFIFHILHSCTHWGRPPSESTTYVRWLSLLRKISITRKTRKIHIIRR